MAAAFVLFIFGIIFIGSVFGDCATDAACARQDRAGHLLWAAPTSGLVIFFIVRWVVEKLLTGQK
ncbi:hypothetical protein [Sphingobium chlorophenolicum]|uniref:hypothetical protein n=1 Tax=Sphingobium chlorophenolicum TaxID=46429 RepID=UPI00059D7BDA|nr:hypothetical protein [Sphingobium chlorophenolicum]